MSRNNPKIIYDAASKVLSVEIEKKKSMDSDIQGNVVIDYDKQGKIIRINLYDFSFDSFREIRKVLKIFSDHAKVSLIAK